MGAPGRGRGRGGAGGRSRTGAPLGRGAGVKVKTAKRRTASSTRWLERQLNDPYVAEARRLGLRSRAAFKLIQIDERFGLLGAGKRVVDLGAAPGGWTAVAAERIRPGKSKAKGQLIAVDIGEMDPVPGAVMLRLDFLADDAPGRIKEALDGPADVVLSDMAAPATGHSATDHLRVMALAEAAYAFAREVLAPGGAFVSKVLRGGTEKQLLDAIKREFRAVKHFKPKASRADSAEIYLVATGFRGD